MYLGFNMSASRLRWIVILCVFIWGVGRAEAQDLDLETFQVANALYENGAYEEAAQLYQQLVNDGYRDSRLQYNLANAYYGSADYGNAILHYRRVLLTNPRDADVRHNLTLARERVVDQFNRSDLNFLETAARLSNWITLTEMALFTLLLWFCWVAARLLYRHPRTERQRTGAQSILFVLSILLIFSLLALGNRVYTERSRPPAVVIAEQTAVLASPALGEAVFTLHSGAEVNITDRDGSWVQVTLPGGDLQGWVSSSTIQPVIEG